MVDHDDRPQLRVRKFLGGLFRFVRNALAIVGLVLIVYHTSFELSVMVSDSMAPTLMGENKEFGERDWVLTEKVSYWFRAPRRWEVVRLQLPDETQVSKRLVGLPGETVSVRDLKLVINGSIKTPPASLSFLRYYGWGNLNQGQEVDCGDEYYYLGDDVRDTIDSRMEGTIGSDAIVGRVWLIVWPWERIGFVNP